MSRLLLRLHRPLLAALLLTPALALGQAPGSPPPRADAPAPAELQPPPPASSEGGLELGAPAHKGFQLAVRLGGAFPAGTHSAPAFGPLSDSYGSQFTLNLDVGAKPSKYVFVGAFLGAGFGDLGPKFAECRSGVISCSAQTYRVGPEVLVSILPGSLIDPWIGAGVGFEYTARHESASGSGLSEATYGPEFAHLMLGADFRVNRYLGVGPFLDVSLAEYTTQTDSSPGELSVTNELPQKSVHAWAQLGARFVLFP